MNFEASIVQFPHPGAEHSVKRKQSEISWNNSETSDHKRKFMKFRGRWQDVNNETHSDNLFAWGEWEPESKVCRRIKPIAGEPHYPRLLWKPYFVPKSSYKCLHNTDPFIFGDQFLYSNCKQDTFSPSLQHLAPGSIILFGSGKKVDGHRQWVLDTIFVVRDRFEYDPREPRRALEGLVSSDFLTVTGEPIRAGYQSDANVNVQKCPPGQKFVLYRGATPDNDVKGMYSFFPARRAESTEPYFSRPLISCTGNLNMTYFNPGKWQGIKANQVKDESVLVSLWQQIVAQVRKDELVLGTYAEMPPCRSETESVD